MELRRQLIWPIPLQDLEHQDRIHLGALVISNMSSLSLKSRQPEHDSSYPKRDAYIQPEYIRAT